MFAHSSFPDLLLHSDDELAEALGAGVARRETLHVWPLSCVQVVHLEDGGKLIYKSQLPPTVEPGFYSAASSSLLPGCQVLGVLGRCWTMTIDWIEAPLLSEVARDDAELVEHGRRVVAEIGAIDGVLPVYLDIGSWSAWLALVDRVLEQLTTLVGDSLLPSTELDEIPRLRSWARSAPVADTIGAGPRVAHGDLRADQIFLAADGYRVIDWQRPVKGPPELDLVALLVEQGIETSRYVAPSVAGVYWFLRLQWAVVAQFELFPGKPWPVFDRWSHEAVVSILDIAG